MNLDNRQTLVYSDSFFQSRGATPRHAPQNAGQTNGDFSIMRKIFGQSGRVQYCYDPDELDQHFLNCIELGIEAGMKALEDGVQGEKLLLAVGTSMAIYKNGMLTANIPYKAKAS